MLRALTERLLLKDFGVQVSEGLSPDRLCPAVPNRLAYIAWIEDLVHGTDLSLSRARTNVNEESDQMERKRRKLDNEKRRILDIGTGACCIYALLGCATNPDWTFVGTDIDAESLRRARRIVSDPLNAELQLRERITLVERSTDDPLLFFSSSSPADAWPAYHATMCNPPFYASRDEMARSAAEKATRPSAVCTGADVEMTTAGGEVAFVSRIIDESCLEPARSSIVWFTSMIGKHASVATLVTKLVSAGVSILTSSLPEAQLTYELLLFQQVDNLLVNDLISGSKTRRWILSWSHLPYHPRLSSTSASRHASAGATTPRSLNDCLRRTFKLTEQHSASSLTQTLTALHRDVVEVTQDTVYPDSIRFRAWRDAWTRRARRSKAAVVCDTSVPPVLACTCTLRQASAEGERHLDVEWTYGSSRDIFETFVSSVIVRWVNS